MSGITDLAFRLITKSHGASLVYVPLISAKALCLGSKKTFDLLVTDPAERPVAVQIFGGDPETIEKAVRILEDFPFDIIDINMGCPVPKVARSAGGAMLLRDPKLAGEIVAAAVGATDRPVTVKLRSGWDEQCMNALEIAAEAQRVGASAVTLHPRTKTQAFSGEADWKLIAELKKVITIPVIGNGDVRTPEDARAMLRQTGCDFVMIARAARGNPWIFSRTLSLLNTGVLPPEPSARQKVEMMVEQCTLLARYEDEHRAALKMRKHAGWYIKGLKNAGITREKINYAKTASEIVRICREIET
jgi:tRNA-dihydrouridine synthase B